jgi:hypothetical protein
VNDKKVNPPKIMPTYSASITPTYCHFHVFIIPTMAGTRRSFYLKEKRDAVHSINFIIERGYSKTMSCCSVRIPILYYQHWRKTLKEVAQVEEMDAFVPFNTTGSARKVQPG